MSQLHPYSNKPFDSFLEALQNQSQREWTWLIGKFRSRLMPVLMSRAKNIAASAVVTQTEFAEEVFEECLLKFYELFENGRFEKYEDLEATIVSISKFKLKEGFARLKRNQRLYFMGAEALSVYREKHLRNLDEEEQRKVELIAEIRTHMDKLPPEESNLIMRFFDGEELQDIAADLSITPAACRKRKQRIIDKLKTLVLKHASLLILLMLK